LHVLSAPPAFVLSQDQTLREDLSHPEASFCDADLRGCAGFAGQPLNRGANRSLQA
jgi:hypothetical protein